MIANKFKLSSNIYIYIFMDDLISFKYVLNMKSCLSQIAIYVTIANSYLPHFFSTLKTFHFKLKSYINK